MKYTKEEMARKNLYYIITANTHNHFGTLRRNSIIEHTYDVFHAISVYNRCADPASHYYSDGCLMAIDPYNRGSKLNNSSLVLKYDGEFFRESYPEHYF